MFSKHELETIAVSLDLTKKTLPFLEQFNIDNDEFRSSAKLLKRKIDEMLKDADAKEKADTSKVVEGK